jgi:Holliday junction resolvase
VTEIIGLAAALRASNNDFLAKLLANRHISSANFHDFLDFATALVEPKSLKTAIAALPRSQAQALLALCSGANPKDLDAETLKKLAYQMLIVAPEGSSSSYSVPEPIRTVMASFANFEFNAFEAAGADRPALDADRDAGVAAFEAMQALTELHFEIDQRYVREVGKRGVGLSDLKRLAGHLRKTNDFARAIYDLARQAKLISTAEGRWMLGVDADHWLELTPAQRFNFLAQVWREQLGDDSARELLAMKTAHPQHGLAALFRHTYPFADSQVNSRISILEAMADLIGLTAGQSSTSWFELVLKNDLDAASQLLATHLPETSERLLIQADLTIIAPGPLPTSVEIELRKFAETEQVSMATTYRINALTISHGLETGLTEASIRELLLRLSGKELPQPVDYLLREAVGRFGRLTIAEGPGEARSIISSVDAILLTEIVSESKLRPFSIRRTPDGDLFSRFEPDVIYFGLRDAGFSAIRVNASGQVISPRTVATRTNTLTVVSSVKSDLERLREHDERIGTEPGDDDLVRQIEFALKNRSKLLITATDRNGQALEFLLEPKNLSNGRLRGIDTRAEIERTLPLERITNALPVSG